MEKSVLAKQTSLNPSIGRSAVRLHDISSNDTTSKSQCSGGQGPLLSYLLSYLWVRYVSLFNLKLYNIHFWTFVIWTQIVRTKVIHWYPLLQVETVLPENILEQREVPNFSCHRDPLELEAVHRDDEATRYDDQKSGHVEGVLVILEPGVQVHPEYGADTSSKSHSKGRDFQVKVHLNDLISGFVLLIENNISSIKKGTS